MCRGQGRLGRLGASCFGLRAPVRLAMMREAQRRVVSNWEAVGLAGDLGSCPGSAHGSGPGRATERHDDSSFRVSRAGVRGDEDDDDDAVPAFFDRRQGARLAADGAWRRAQSASVSN